MSAALPAGERSPNSRSSFRDRSRGAGEAAPAIRRPSPTRTSHPWQRHLRPDTAQERPQGARVTVTGGGGRQAPARATGGVNR